jgi:PmbA protein
MNLNKNESWETLSDLVHKTVARLEKKGVTCAEAFFTSTQTIQVVMRNSEILTQNAAEDAGVGFRVAVEQDRVGFACTNTLSEKTIFDAGEKALAIAKVSSQVPNFTLPEKNKLTKVEGLFDPEVERVTVEETVDTARTAIDTLEGFDKRIVAKDGRVSYQAGWRGILNTLGVDCEERESKAFLYLGGSGKQGDQVTGICTDFMFKRTADLYPEIVGESVGKMVIAQFEPQRVPSFEGTVVFGPEAVSYQICDALIDALRGENVIGRRSGWIERVGQIVASENLTITDNAMLEKGFASRSFDDEGFASQNTVIVRNGELKSFLHHAMSACSLKMKNTGNASRFPGSLDMTRMIVGNGYRAKPEVYPSNLVIQPGKKSKTELLSEVEKGVLVESMAGFAQPGSGVISAQLSRACYVKNGEVQYPVKGGMVSGVAFDWLKQISGVSNDAKQFANCITPSVQIENVKVIGT